MNKYFKNISSMHYFSWKNYIMIFITLHLKKGSENSSFYDMFNY